MARPTIEPNPENASIHELKEAARVGTPETSTRCVAIQMLIIGISREQVCQALLVSARTILKWIHAFNKHGVDGLIANKRPGRSRKIPREKASHFVDLIENPEQVDRTHWTARAFHGYLQETYHIECSYSTVVRFFHEQNFALKVPQPWPDRQDETLRKAFRERLKTLHEQTDIDIWFMDESGFEGECRSRRRWDQKGRKTRVVRNGDHLRMNVMGMVCPRTGEFFALEVSHVDSVVFQSFLDEAARFISPIRKRNILILDNASWHRNKKHNWHFFEALFLPAYSPDLNPIERIWFVMKSKWFTHFHAKNLEALIEQLDKAILDVIHHPDAVKNTTSIRTLF